MIYRFELRRQVRGAIVWAAVLAIVFFLLVYGFYPIFLDCRPIVESYIASFPAGFAESFGFNLDDLFSLSSFYNLVALYESLLGVIFISAAVICVFSREKREKCADFLLTKPVARSDVFRKKLLACLTLLFAADLPYLILYLVSLNHFGSAVTGTSVLCALCLPLTQLLFLSVGVFAAVFLKRVRSPAGLGALIGMFAFLLSVVQSLTEKEALKYLNPLFYFSSETVSETGRLDVPCTVLAVGLTVCFTAAAYFKYTREDLAV